MSEAKKESLRESLGLPKEIFFKVKGWTSFAIHFGRMSENEYFSTTAECRSGSGQCQDRALEGPECGLARAFWLKYDKYHIQQMKSIPLEVLHEMKKDLEILKENYAWGFYRESPKWDKKFKSKDIGILAESGMSLTEIMDRVNLHKTLQGELPKNEVVTKKMKL